ncbi:MAG TPA: DNA-formamidopyrimidine glycosylase family protein [Stellaceae bacterium]|nr:DNA-formamidopyrimidine glycosylase family protein [Stellaceae bacterium]
MPELPDVESFRRLAETCVGRVIRRVVASDPRMLEGVSPDTVRKRLTGARVERVRRHGKHLFIEFSQAGCLAMHFGTNGSLHHVPADDADPPYVRFSLVFADGDRLAYVNPRRIGTVQWAKDAAAFVAAAELGPDALDRHFDLPVLARAIAGRTRDIKSILMDQRLVAGIGNIYADEILFQAGIYPGAKADTLERAQIAQIFTKLKHVLKTAVDRGAGAETGVERLPGGFLLPERHPDGHCPRCGGALATLRQSGRTSYYCPRCQRRR